ncbi:MAG TPA: ABC transporter substrate-binding protein [Anaerolineales bacterium]|nr:ABC transporter substrate-binding protein [Anaerolineales bacterium]
MVVSLVLAGCGAPATPQVVEKTVVQTQIVEVTAVAQPEEGGEIAVIVKTGNSSFWQNVQTGAMAAQKELQAQTPKLSVTFLGAQSESNVNEEINIVESAIDRGVKAIVLAPSDVTALQPAVKKAKDAGIPVIIIDSKLDGDPSQYVSFLATDNKAAGEAAAKQMIDLLAKEGKTEGKIQVMSYVAGVGSEIGRVGGFNDYIKANSKFTLLETQYSNADMPTALNQTTNVLQANPDLVGIFGANEPTAIGMARAISEAGLSGKIVAIGFDGNSALAGFVKDGTLNAIIVQSSYNMGYLGVKTAYDVAFGGKTVEAYVDTGFLIVTPDNIDSEEAKNVLY